ncbi:class I SAM-dependent methyltransferase [Guggenheimella bovis]
MYTIFADFYDTHIDYDYSRLIKLVHDFPVERAKALDIGCGTGQFSEILSQSFQKVLAIDPSEEMLSLARFRHQRTNIEYLLGSTQYIPTNETFELVVVINDVINYITPDKLPQEAQNIMNAITQGGYLLIDVSSPKKLREKLGNEIYYIEGEGEELYWMNSYDEEEDKVDFELVLYKKEGELYRRDSEWHTQYVHEADELQRCFEPLELVYKEETEDRYLYLFRRNY